MVREAHYKMRETYISVDIETNGPIPMVNSMLSIGAAACSPERGIFDQFSVNLLEFPGSTEDEKTMTEFWAKYPKEYAATREAMYTPKIAMAAFDEWLTGLPGKPVMVAYPAGFDFTFIYWYFHNYLQRCPFGFQCIDMKTYAMALMKTPFKETVKKNMPVRWFDDVPENKHAHVAIVDAIEQAHLWLAMLSIQK